MQVGIAVASGLEVTTLPQDARRAIGPGVHLHSAVTSNVSGEADPQIS
jgi:hypothetical protein